MGISRFSICLFTLLGPLPLWAQDLPHEALAAALAVAVDSARSQETSQKYQVYLHEGMYVTEGNLVREQRMPRRWLDSLQRVGLINGTCAYLVPACDRSIKGYLVTLWKPQSHPTSRDVLLIQVNVNLVLVARPPSSEKPAFQPDSATTPYPDKFRAQPIHNRTVWVTIARDSSGIWRPSAKD